MKRKKDDFLAKAMDLFSEKEDPNEPIYDPVHLGGVIIASLTGIGCLYWLLWTLLVFEGGLPLKAQAAASVLFTSKTLADYGYEGSPYAMGAFEGWMGNLAALALTFLVVAGLHRLHQPAGTQKRKRRRP